MPTHLTRHPGGAADGHEDAPNGKIIQMAVVLNLRGLQ